MPFIIDETTYRPPRFPRGRSFGAARPGALESLIISNGLVLNDQFAAERYYVKNVDGLWGADIRDSREPKVNQDGEDVYDTLLGGKTVTISGKIEALSLDSMREMEQRLEVAFPHSYEYPIVFDRSMLREEGVKRGAVVGNNQCINPSFEFDLANWATGDDINTLERATSYFTDVGDWYCEVTFHGSPWAAFYRGDFTATPAQYVMLAIDVFIPDTWDGGIPYIFGGIFRGVGEAQEPGDYTEFPALSNTQADLQIRNRWQRIWITYKWDDVVDATGGDLNVLVDEPPSEGSILRFDAASIEAQGAFDLNTKPTFFDGESPGWMWEGAPHASASVPDAAAYRQDVFIKARRIDKLGIRDEQTNYQYNRDFQIPLRMADPCIYSVKTKTIIPEVLTNLTPNPNFESSGTGWTTMSGGTTAIQSGGWGSTGAFLRSLHVTGSAAGVIGAQIPTGTGGIPIPGGLTYSASVVVNYVTKSNGGGLLNLDMYFYDAAGTIITGSTAASTNTVGVQTLKVENVQSPFNARFMQVRVYTADNVNAAVNFYFDAVMINEGPTVQSFFDGASTAAWWTGAVGNSASKSMKNPLYIKNHGNYMASPRLKISGPWTNFAIVNTTLMEGETASRRFSITGLAPGGGYFFWDEDEPGLVDNAGINKDGFVDSTSNGLRLAPGTNILTLAGTGLGNTSGLEIAYEDTWK